MAHTTAMAHPAAMGPPAARSAFPRLRGLDGIRALAVLAVVAFHLGWEGLPGGFLGVEVFFVVSGYLITGLLLHEWETTGRIGLLSFWMRRARRLLPALFLLLLATLAIAVLLFPSEVARLRSDALAATVYITNWYLIAGDQPYFETIGRPSALLHLWSLAIEEQFYLLWPPVLLAALAVAGRRGALATAGVGVAVSIVLAILLQAPGGDPSRTYYGTDTRAAGLLIGAVLAFRPRSGRPTEARTLGDSLDRAFGQVRALDSARRRSLIGDLCAAGALVTLLGVMWSVAEADAGLLVPLLVVDLATVVLIATVVGPAARVVPTFLEAPPMRWLGTRSYAVYLWHWPVFVFTRPTVDVPLDGPANVLFRLVVVGLLAEGSYRYVERPIRDGALGRLVDAVREGRRAGAPAHRNPRVAATVTAALATLVLLGSVATAAPPPPPAGIPITAVDGLVTPPPREAPARPSALPRPSAAAPSPSGRTPAPTAAIEVTPSPEPIDPGRVTAFGESVLIAAAPWVAREIGPFELEAEIGRQVEDHIEVIRRRAAAGTLGDTVVLAIGNNGPILSQHREELMGLLRDVDRVVWLNVSLAREWTDFNNRSIEVAARDYPNVRIADWHGASWGHKELFAEDMVHPNKDGCDLLARLVRSALAAP